MKGKVDLIYDLLNSKLVSLEGKLEAIDKGINDPQVGLTAKLGVMQSAIENKILESQEAVKSAVAQTLSSSLTSLQNSMNGQYDVIAQKLDTINMALKLANVEAGIMEGSTRGSLKMLPEAYKVLYNDKALKDAFLKVMVDQTPTTTTIHVTGSGDITLTNSFPEESTYKNVPSFDIDLFHKCTNVGTSSFFEVIKHRRGVVCTGALPVTGQPGSVQQYELDGSTSFNGDFNGIGSVIDATSFTYRYYYLNNDDEGYPMRLNFGNEVNWKF